MFVFSLALLARSLCLCLVFRHLLYNNNSIHRIDESTNASLHLVPHPIRFSAMFVSCHFVVCLQYVPLDRLCNGYNFVQFLIAIFTVEFLLYCIAYGFSGSARSCIQQRWRQLDMVVLFLSYLQLIPGAQDNVWASFRALRFVNFVRNDDMDLLLTVLQQSMRRIYDIAVVFVVFYLFFGIVGVQVRISLLLPS